MSMIWNTIYIPLENPPFVKYQHFHFWRETLGSEARAGKYAFTAQIRGFIMSRLENPFFPEMYKISLPKMG